MATSSTDMRGSGGELPDSFFEDAARTRVEAVEALPMERVNPPRAFFRGAGHDVADIFRFRELLDQLVRKELKVKYKDSVLGFFWTLVRPMTQLIIYYLAFTSSSATSSRPTRSSSSPGWWSGGSSPTSSAAARARSSATPACSRRSTSRARSSRSRSVGAALVNFVLQMVVLFAAIGITAVFTDNRVVLTSDLALVPLALLVCLLWALAMGLFLAAATVYLRDLQHLIEIVLLALFWLVPIVYPVVLRSRTSTETGHTFLLQVLPGQSRCSTW